MNKITVLSSFAACILLSSCAREGSAVREPRAPSIWPVAGLSLPEGTKDALFTPSTASEVIETIGENTGKKAHRTSDPVQQQSWTAMFAFEGESSQVFDHVDSILVKQGFKVSDALATAVGTPGETLVREYANGEYSVRLTYWKFSDKPGSRPYHLVIKRIDLAAPAPQDNNLN